MDDSIVNDNRVGVGLRPTSVLGVSLLIAVLLVMPMAVADGTRTTFSGRGFGGSVHTAFLNVKFADTGDLPAEGGGIEATVLSVKTDLEPGGILPSTPSWIDYRGHSGDEVIVSSAHSDITCGSSGKPVPKDFMTGGGFIEVNGGKANFGFVAGLKPGKTTISGQLNYLDHASGLKVKAETITAYGGMGTTTRRFSGDATVNGAAGYTFTVIASDVAEPGRGADTFSIPLST